MSSRKNTCNENNPLHSEALELIQQAKGLADMADDWTSMGSDNITVDDLQHRAARLREKSRKLTDNIK